MTTVEAKLTRMLLLKLEHEQRDLEIIIEWLHIIQHRLDIKLKEVFYENGEFYNPKFVSP